MAKLNYISWSDEQKRDFIKELTVQEVFYRKQSKPSNDEVSDANKIKFGDKLRETMELRFAMENSMRAGNELEIDNQRLSRQVASLKYELKSYRESFGLMMDPYPANEAKP